MTRVLAATTVEKAKKWAEKAGTGAITSWSERPAQDYAYRQYVVELPLF